ncbi:uroporphyrinogen-III synthase [Jannaschia rubra]|uniref:uroporphyrinogen-III synthase n=1 Tax=Jannaschia rubra TaxID=282197 RepID=UPI0024902131|nr:uroporphyrinogen-III synthase [Jannaschia rubra]
MPDLPVLLTRPQADSERLAGSLRAAGVGRMVVSPLSRIVPEGTLPEFSGGVLLTSANAVAAFRALDGPRGLSAWVVGPRTAEMARKAGFDVRLEAPDAATLLPQVPQDAPPLVHLRGAVARVDLAAALRKRGIAATDAVLYRQDALDLSSEARGLLRAGPVLVPLYSPRSAVLFAAACPPEAWPSVRLVALSPAVAEAGPVPPVAVADRPDGEAMMRAILANLAAMEG